MKKRTIKRVTAALLAVALVLTSFATPATKKAVTAATIGTGSDYTVTATDDSSTQTTLTFKANNYAQYVIAHFKVNDGAMQNVNMTSGNGYDYNLAIAGLKTGDTIKVFFTYNKGGLQYDSPEMTYKTGSSTSTNASIEKPFGLVASSPSNNTIGVVWGRGNINSYNVYIDGNKVSSAVGCAYYTYTGYAAGTHTVAISTVSGSSESEKVSVTVTVAGSTAPATTKAAETGVVYIYQDINYGGRVAALNEGSYNLAALSAKGFRNDDLTALKVASGYEAVLYWDDNFQGAQKVVSSDTAWIGNDWNDKMSSIVVRKKTQTTQAPTTTKASTSTDTSIAQPFGLVVSCPANNTIGVVWGAGNINNYNVYIDNNRVASGVKCAYYTYTGIAAGTHTVSVTTVSGNKESAKTSLSVNVTGSGSVQQTTTTKQQQPSGGTVSGVEKPALRNDIPVNDKMFLQLNNKTNGKYSDSQIYWCVLGYNSSNQLCYLDTNGNLIPANTGMNTIEKNGRKCANICHPISEKSWVYLPSIVSGRMYLSYGSPVYITFNQAADGRIGYAGPDLNNTSDPNQDVLFEFAEFTVTGREYWGNTTRVDFYSFPMVTRLYGTGGFDNRPGDYPTYDKVVGDIGSRTDIFNKFKNNAPSEWKTLADDKRIMAPCKKTFNEGQAYGRYFDNYINEFWNKYSSQNLVFQCEAGTFTGRVEGDRMRFTKAGDGGTYYVYKPTTQDVLEGKGNFNRGNSTELVIEAQLCAAFNRGVATDPANYNNPSAYYKNSTYNWYSRFWHENSVSNLAYGFCYDDVNDQSTLLHYTNATALVIDLKW
ncbi:MAG: hypothetical protein K6G64_01235 [Eubacterium sp.]|nr:hypothetical protein [Eubacterium sp.]